jgi:Rrf2 family protein
MQLTRAADYAVRIMVHMATLPSGSRQNLTALAEAGDVAGHFLSKVLQSLSHAGLIDSQRGLNGGFSLAKPAEQITVLDIVEAIEGRLLLNVCLAPGESCGRKSWCPTHAVWAEAQLAMAGVLRRATIASLAAH